MKRTNIIIFSVLFSAFFLNSDVFSRETAKGKKDTSLTMEDTKVEGEVEKPEFINIIQKRRVQFKEKGELTVSFKKKMLLPLLKNEIEDSFSKKVDKILDTGSINFHD